VKYLLMIYGNREKWESMPAGAWPEAIARQEAFNAKYRQTGELLGSYGLADAAQARLVRRVDGLPAVTDGPYLETKEYLEGGHLSGRPPPPASATCPRPAQLRPRAVPPRHRPLGLPAAACRRAG
jgi:hypothetical protein